MIYFADTSALIKRYLSEVGSSYVRGLAGTTGTVFYQTFLTPLETASALYRRYRAGRISTEELSFLLKSYAAHSHEEYLLVPYSESLIDLAVKLIARHPIRTLDSVQLASVLWLRDNLPAGALPLIFLSADGRLVSSAREELVQAENPEERS